MPKVLFAYRTAIHESTKFSPFHLIYGRSPTLPIDVYLGRTNSYEGFSSYPDNVHEMHKVLGDSYATVRQNLSQAHGCRKNLHDHSANTSEFQCGDRVWLYIPAVKQGQSKKLSSLWRGSYTVIDKTNSVNYRIQLIGISRSLVVHYNRLKLRYGEPEPSSHLTRSGRNRSDNERPAASTPDGSIASDNGLVDFNSSDNQASDVGGYASSSLPGIVLSDNQASAVGGYASSSLPGIVLSSEPTAVDSSSSSGNSSEPLPPTAAVAGSDEPLPLAARTRSGRVYHPPACYSDFVPP